MNNKRYKMEAKIELTWEEFKERYAPIKQTEKKGFNRYFLDVFTTVEVPIKDTVIKKQRVHRENYNKALMAYSMYVWTVLLDGTIVSGKRFGNAVGYIICERPHYIEDTIKIKLTHEEHE
jgi:hypothetical protein